MNSFIEYCNVNGKLETKALNNSYIGGISGYIKNITIKNNYINSEILSSAKSSVYSGSIAGMIENSSILICNIDCSISCGSMSIGNSYTGGIGGIISESNIKNCSIKGNFFSYISVSGGYSGNLGGIAGYTRNGNINACYINGTISADYSSVYNSNIRYYAGGIVGNIGDGNIANCFVNSSIFCTSRKRHLGLIIGEGSRDILKNNYTNNSTLNDNIINSNDENGKDGKSLDSSHFNEKFYKRLGWDFENIWIWDENNNTPVLRQINNISENAIKKISIEKNELSNILNNNIWI